MRPCFQRPFPSISKKPSISCIFNLLKQVAKSDNFDGNVFWQIVILPKAIGMWFQRFTHETEKDKTRNVLLGMTKLRISKLGISKTEKLVWENPTLIGKYLKSNYEKTKNWEFLKWEYCHKTYTSNLRERQNWEIEIPRIPISENWIYRNDIW